MGSELHMYSWMQRLLRQIDPAGDFAAAKKNFRSLRQKIGVGSAKLLLFQVNVLIKPLEWRNPRVLGSLAR